MCIKSIIKYNKNNITFYILDTGISSTTKVNIKNYINKYMNYKINFIPIETKEFSVFPKTIDYISIATYTRLNLSKYIKNEDRVLYLDIDIIVSGNLEQLWNTNLCGKTIGACYDVYIEKYNSNHKYEIGLSENEYYFNAGVLLIDMKKWGDSLVFNKSIQIIEEYKEKIKYQDQDILNIIFKNDVLYLNTRYNFMPSQKSLIKKKIYKNEEIEKTIMPIIISHYCGPKKAWDIECKHFNSFIYYTLSGMKHKKLFLYKLKYLIRKFRLKIMYKIY